MDLPHTLVIIPSFNERENIASLIEADLSLSPALDVLVVDDGSPDGTAQIVRELQGTYLNRLHLIERAGKGGRGSAVLAGLTFGLERDYQALMEMDADFSHRPEEIPSLLAALAQYDWVVGSRYLRKSEIRGWGWRRTIFSALANRYARAILRIPIYDYTNGFRAYRRSAVEALEMDRIVAKGYVVLSEVAYQLYRKRLTVGEVPTLFINRRRGQSNLSFKEISEAFLSVLRIRFGRSSASVQTTHSA